MNARNDIVPLTQLARRAPEAGRIRMGIKDAKAKGGRRAIDTWRFTSPFPDVIGQLAALYGGTAQVWFDQKASPQHQFEVITTVDELPVILVPGQLSVWYEMWSGGGCVRRCDGEMCETPVERGEDYELITCPCMCVAQGHRQCDPHTRLAVIIPQLDFRGVWRLETKGWNAVHEMPGMFDLITELGAKGQMVNARLGIDKRTQPTKKGIRHFVVPRISIAQTVLELQHGLAATSLGSGVATASPALGAAPVPIDTPTPCEHCGGFHASTIDCQRWEADDEIEDAVIVDDELVAIETSLGEDAVNFGLDPARYVRAIRATVGATDEVDAEQRRRMRDASHRVRDGAITPLGFDAGGRIQWQVRR